MKARCSLVHI